LKALQTRPSLDCRPIRAYSLSNHGYISFNTASVISRMRRNG
jgi:hypothetical protein